MNPHELLGVPRGASRAEVRRAFRQYALEHHPDRGGRRDRFEAGQAAYRSLLAGAPAGRRPTNVVFHHRARGWRAAAEGLRQLSRRYRDMKERA